MPSWTPPDGRRYDRFTMPLAGSSLDAVQDHVGDFADEIVGHRQMAEQQPVLGRPDEQVKDHLSGGVGYRRTVMPSEVTKRLRHRRLQGARRRRENRGAAVTRGPEPPFRCAA
jgi:hypothetical protein